MTTRNAQLPEGIRDAVNAMSPKVQPVKVVSCPLCFGDGYLEFGIDQNTGLGHSVVCAYCAGRGRIATEGGEV